MPSLEFFLLTARLNAVVVDYLDAGDDPDIQPISATIELRPRIPTGKLVWGPTLSPPQGIALPSIKARFDTDGVLRTIQNAPINELQRITVTGDPFTLSFQGEPTDDIPQNATHAQVETALEALSTVGASNANVTGPDGGPFDVVFNDALGNQDVPQLTATNATITTVRAGTLMAGVKLTANTPALGLGEYDPTTETGGLVYDCIFTNVVYNKKLQEIHPFAFAAPTTGGETIDLATVTKLPPAAGI
ncbi:hypothetical protein [Mycobacterium asiaticum]|uniref:hypothetical protein n=1 Tax=Mycobacterium asiaticum TaxID=1790 RepID=UPI0007EF3240|nr:hypothetical protein [Mycobacterium asiaticum]OBJ60246.1 hypothetical protein A9W94_13860 [Mycobacterium asiaticum]